MADNNVTQRVYYVYVLFRHDTAEPFYVGKGFGRRWNVHERLSKHDKNKYKKHVIQQAIDAGVEVPKIKIADNLSEQEAFDLERQLILSIGRWSNGTGPLLNMSDGGEGQTGFRHSEATKLLIGKSALDQITTPRQIMWATEMGRANKGRKMPPNVLDALTKANTGRKHTDEAKAKIGGRHKGKVISQEQREKLSAAGKGRVVSEQTREKLSAAGKRRVFSESFLQDLADRNRARAAPLSEETKEKISQSKVGTKLSEERKAQISEELRNRPPISDETREKLSAWQRGKKRSEADKQKMRDGWARRNAAQSAGKQGMLF